MKKVKYTLNVQQKLFLIPAAIIGVMFAAWGLYSAHIQAKESEDAFRGQLTLLAHTSTFMQHGSAEELATEKGWTFHRVLADVETDTTPEGRMEAKALAELKKDAGLKTFESRIATDSSDLLAVYVPARIQSLCFTCHNPTGIDIFSDKKEGDLVAVFGVTGSLAEVEAHKAQVALLTAVIGVLCIVVTVLIIGATSRKVIVGPVRDLMIQSQKVSTGDLRQLHTPHLDGKMSNPDEIGALSRAYKTMIDSLRALILRLKDSSNSVSSAAHQISTTSEEMAAGTFEQTTHVSEVSNSISEISESIRENSDNAARAAGTAAIAREASVKGEELVRRTIDGMKRISVATQQSAVTVNSLERSSTQISEIIAVIDGIADQTNLLALNAAIEAARAGEQGRGFAVVAAEVQKLADRTTSATKEIADMITKIQTDTRSAVQSMNEGAREVENGIQLAEQAGTALQEIRTTSETMSDMMQQIARASRDQSTNAEQVTASVGSITNMTEQTSTAIQQISQSLEELNTLTVTLQGIVNNFTLDEGEAYIASSGHREDAYAVRQTDKDAVPMEA